MRRAAAAGRGDQLVGGWGAGVAALGRDGADGVGGALVARRPDGETVPDAAPALRLGRPVRRARRRRRRSRRGRRRRRRRRSRRRRRRRERRAEPEAEAAREDRSTECSDRLLRERKRQRKLLLQRAASACSGGSAHAAVRLRHGRGGTAAARELIDGPADRLDVAGLGARVGGEPSLARNREPDRRAVAIKVARVAAVSQPAPVLQHARLAAHHGRAQLAEAALALLGRPAREFGRRRRECAPEGGLTAASADGELRRPVLQRPVLLRGPRCQLTEDRGGSAQQRWPKGS
mmetsp:Transcript_11231/g.35856  ORF Transcript_11231/g.35856 Transcript_11231/m.35856 type:complete len:291 (+) Transcript_11231:971-1843(+)